MIELDENNLNQNGWIRIKSENEVIVKRNWKMSESCKCSLSEKNRKWFRKCEQLSGRFRRNSISRKRSNSIKVMKEGLGEKWSTKWIIKDRRQNSHTMQKETRLSLCAINKTDPAGQTATNKWHFNGNANHKKALKKSARLSVARGRQNSSVIRQRLKQNLIAPERLSGGERYTDWHN